MQPRFGGGVKGGRRTWGLSLPKPRLDHTKGYVSKVLVIQDNCE